MPSSRRYLPDPGIKLMSLIHLALKVDSLPLSHQGSLKVTNHRKFNGLKQYPFFSTQLCSSEVWIGLDRLLWLGSHKAKIQNVKMTGFLSIDSEERSASKLIHIIGCIQFLEVGELRSQVPWFPVGSWMGNVLLSMFCFAWSLHMALWKLKKKKKN